MTDTGILVLRVTAPGSILVAARFYPRAATVLAVLLVVALSVGPPWLAFEGDAHVRAVQAMLVIACTLLGSVMHVIGRARARVN